VKARLFTDGGARGNPGPAAYGFVLEGEDGQELAREAATIGHATNNVAEYRGVIAGLERALALGVDDVTVVSDSELVMKQMRGEYNVKNAALRELSLEAARVARRFDRVEYTNVLRTENELADRLVNEALDGADGAPPARGVRSALEAGDFDALAELLAPDVEFRSPAVYRPYRGRETVVALLRVVASVFEDFRYLDEWRDGPTTILRFEARVGDRELQGVDILEDGSGGLVERFTVMIRPLSGLQTLAATVAARTESS